MATTKKRVVRKKVATKSSEKTVSLIVSDQVPTLKLKAGMKFEVTTAKVVTPDLKNCKGIAARLCGGTSTCLALINLD